MSTTTHPQAEPAHSGPGRGHAVPLRVLAGTWAVLVVLTWTTVAATKVDLGNLNIVIALGIAVVKCSFVALFFMHLRYDKPFHAVVFITAALFVMLFISLTLMDSKGYASSRIPGYAPEIPQPAGEEASAAESGSATSAPAEPAAGEKSAAPAGADSAAPGTTAGESAAPSSNH